VEKKPFVESIRLQNFLSYGPDDAEIKLQPLNVVIGPNTSGKSNFIEAFALLRKLPLDEQLHQSMGNVKQWVWKGASEDAKIEVKIDTGDIPRVAPLIYRIKFLQHELFGISEEIIQGQRDPDERYFESVFPNDPIALGSDPAPQTGRTPRTLNRNEWNSSKSVLSQLRDAFNYPEITFLTAYFSVFHFYREWYSGANSVFRLPEQASLPSAYLLENASNLALVLSNLRNDPKTWDLMNNKLTELYPDFEGLQIKIEFGQAVLNVSQKGLNESIPVTRLSDGTLRYLFLLTVLCHPEPPPLICLEEPELGLYPEALPVVGDLLKAAAERTQLIVTTHSDVLVSAFTDSPESVLICERDEKGSHLRRLESAPLKKWLKKFALGDLWLEGRLGIQR
jgi:predicted ATPase